MKSFEVFMTSRLGICSGLNEVVFLVDLGLKGGKKIKHMIELKKYIETEVLGLQWTH